MTEPFTRIERWDCELGEPSSLELIGVIDYEFNIYFILETPDGIQAVNTAAGTSYKIMPKNMADALVTKIESLIKSKKLSASSTYCIWNSHLMQQTNFGGRYLEGLEEMKQFSRLLLTRNHCIEFTESHTELLNFDPNLDKTSIFESLLQRAKD